MPDEWNDSQSQCGASIFLFGTVVALKGRFLICSKALRDVVEFEIGTFCHDTVISLSERGPCFASLLLPIPGFLRIILNDHHPLPTSCSALAGHINASESFVMQTVH